MRFEYSCYTDFVILEHTKLKTTSIQCVGRNGKRIAFVRTFRDISLDEAFANRLARLCTEEQVEPCHFLDVFYDLSE